MQTTDSSTIKITVKTKLLKAVSITKKAKTREKQRLGEYPQRKAKPETKQKQHSQQGRDLGRAMP